MKLSVVIPTLDEAAAIEDCLVPLQGLRGKKLEVIVVDGESQDDTVRLARRLADRVLSSPRGRARQMNAGWSAARGETILFLHADTRITEKHLTALLTARAQPWGHFDVRIDDQHRIFRWIEKLINVRSRLTAIATGDQAIFVARDRLEQVGGYPAIELMEDIALTDKLRRTVRPAVLRPPVVTSARRWTRHGVVRTVLLMWALRLGYYVGVPPERLARCYRHAR